MIEKKVKQKVEYYIDFSDEEMQELNINKKDKFSASICESGIILKKFPTIDIDLNNFSKENLIYMITYCHENDISFEEFINITLEKECDYYNNNEYKEYN